MKRRFVTPSRGSARTPNRAPTWRFGIYSPMVAGRWSERRQYHWQKTTSDRTSPRCGNSKSVQKFRIHSGINWFKDLSCAENWQLFSSNSISPILNALRLPCIFGELVERNRRWIHRVRQRFKFPLRLCRAKISANSSFVGPKPTFALIPSFTNLLLKALIRSNSK